MKRVRKTALLLLAVSSFALPGFSQSTGRSGQADLAAKYKYANAAMPRARKAFADKDYALARTEAMAILAKMPEFSEASLMMAKISYIEKNYMEALDYIQTAKVSYLATLTYSTNANQERLAAMRRRRDDQDGILSDLRGGLSRATNEQQRNEIQNKIDRVERIRADLDRVLSEPPDVAESDSAPPEYFFFHGNILLRLNKPAEAVQQYSEALRLDPAYGDAANNLASLYFAAKQYDKALEVIRGIEAQGVGINPELKKAVLQAAGQS